MTKIGRRLGGALGWGVAVFRSLLENCVRHFDLEQKDKERFSLFAVSMRGYLLGCLACEFSPPDFFVWSVCLGLYRSVHAGFRGRSRSSSSLPGAARLVGV